MTKRIDLFDSTYSHFTEQVLDAIRKETFGEDIGQNSWLTVDEYDRFIPELRLGPEDHLLEVASGSGGPALYLANKFGCNVTGVDANESGIATATQSAVKLKRTDRVNFRLVDASAPLPFADNTFDGLLCIDSMNHFPSRLSVFREWQRVLRPGRRALFTDPVVITGPVTNRELFDRSNIGLFVFIPPETTERFITDAGLRLVNLEDVTANIALTSGRWLNARAERRDALLQIESETDFDSLQTFLTAVHTLTSDRRLSRFAFLAEK